MAAGDLRPKEQTLAFARGDNPPFQFTFTNEDDGTPIDFTGDTVVLTVNPTSDGTGVNLFQLSPTAPLDATGVVAFQATTADMDLEPGTYYYDVEWTSGTTVRTLVRGEFVIGTDVTN